MHPNGLLQAVRARKRATEPEDYDRLLPCSAQFIIVIPLNITS
jgi:hypothetical protein